MNYNMPIRIEIKIKDTFYLDLFQLYFRCTFRKTDFILILKSNLTSDGFLPLF